MPDRFDKFTERARLVLGHAQEEAQRRNQNLIGPDHLLLGLLREEEGLACRVLQALWVDLDALRAAVDGELTRASVPSQGFGLLPSAKRVLELAVDEAHRAFNPYLGTEHLLLGLVRQGEGRGVEVLRWTYSLTLDQLRGEVKRAHEAPPTLPPSPPRQPVAAARRTPRNSYEWERERTPVLELLEWLQRHSFTQVAATQYHLVMHRTGHPVPVTVPFSMRGLRPQLVEGLLRDAGLDPDQFWERRKA